MKIKVALEWFLNPDHLAMIVGIHSGKYRDAGLDIEIVEPKEHYDGFKDLQSGKIDIHCNEPLHLFEHHFDGIKSLGCFFETRGGVMMRASSVAKLRANEKIKITTPASNPVTNKIGFEILKRYAKKNNFALDAQNVEFVETDFWHLANLRKDETFDGAWLCFYNFEGVEAKELGFENLFIDQFESPYPNFSALEFMSTESVIEQKGEAICEFLKITNEMASYAKANPLEARSIYYEYTKQPQTKLMDEIITETLFKLESNVATDANRWRELYEFLEGLELVNLSDDEYAKIWQAKGH